MGRYYKGNLFLHKNTREFLFLYKKLMYKPRYLWTSFEKFDKKHFMLIQHNYCSTQNSNNDEVIIHLQAMIVPTLDGTVT